MSVFMNILSMLRFGQWLFNLVFYFILSWIFIAFYNKFNFMLQILIKIFRPIKIKIKRFEFSFTNIFPPFIIMTWFKLILLCWYKKYSVCVIWFFNLHKLFPAFICADNIESLVNSLFGVKNVQFFSFFYFFIIF